MTRTGKIITFILLFFIAFSSACSGTAPKAASKPLKIAWTLWQGDYTLLVAEKAGIFDKYGVDVEPVRYDSATQAIIDMAGVQVDGGIYSMNDLILVSNQADLKGVYVIDNGGVFSIVGSPDITKIQQIRGKRIGLNFHSSGELFVSNMLKTARMTFKDVTYIEMSPSQVPGQIPGSADAGLVWEPYTSLALSRGQKLIYQSPENSALLPRLLAFRTSVINEDPQRIHNFLLAWNEAVNYRTAHPQDADAMIAKMTGLVTGQVATTKGTTLYTNRDNIQLFSVNPTKDPTSIYHIAEVNRDFLITNGYITIPPDLNSLLDPSLLK